jgi:general secretion pathway protein G
MRKTQSGVTIIELIIAMALVAMLASITIPAFSGYVARARDNRAIGDIGRISVELYRWRTANGGIFPDDLADTNIDAPLDPWGNEYQYVNAETAGAGALRTNADGNEANTDFDLFSNGADGASSTSLTADDAADDIVRTNNGAFIGKASDI